MIPIILNQKEKSEEKSSYDSFLDLILDQENPIGQNKGPIGLLDAISEKSDKKRRKAEQRKKQALEKLARKVKNIDYARNQCKLKQAKLAEKNRDRAERWALAARGDTRDFSVPGGGSVRQAPPSPPICKACGERHW